ncbi:hypothetical protein MMC09_006564 [Bachmanniomyces sp. S44760]|nr:hypothetical protein [Bachmanniomyces sp. S44760]
MSPRPIFAFLSLILTAGACLLILLVLLAGAIDHDPINKIYFLQADTSKISGAPPLSRWTFWNLCTVDASGGNVCPHVHPAFPLDPPSGRNFGTTDGVPMQFVGTRKYFYLTRFMFAFVLISLFFAASSLLLGLSALCTRIGAYLSGLLCSVALFFQTLTAALMTAAYVMGRNDFNMATTAILGKYAFGFMWAAMACLFLSTILFFVGGATSKSSSGGRGGFFGGGRSNTKKSAHNRGSFVTDAESQRKVNGTADLEKSSFDRAR